MWLEVDFGAGRAGLATVGYRLYDNTGADALARTTVGVVEIGQGAYGVDRATIPVGVVGIEWDTGGGSPEYAHESVSSVPEIIALAVWAAQLQGTFSASDILSIIAAPAAGKASGLDVLAPVFRDLLDTKDVVTSVTDADGNRTSTVYNP